jgi:hypothetical protein
MSGALPVSSSSLTPALAIEIHQCSEPQIFVKVDEESAAITNKQKYD